MNIYVIIRQNFVKICKIVCLQHNMQEKFFQNSSAKSAKVGVTYTKQFS